MRTETRWVWALGLVIVDLVAFALPLTAIVAAVVIFTRPPWFRRWVDDLYSDG